MPKKTFPFPYNQYIMKIGQDFLDILFLTRVNKNLFFNTRSEPTCWGKCPIACTGGLHMIVTIVKTVQYFMIVTPDQD